MHERLFSTTEYAVPFSQCSHYQPVKGGKNKQVLSELSQKHDELKSEELIE